MTDHRLEEILGPGGTLSLVLAPHYQRRPQQETMAWAVAGVLQSGGCLLVEAPTGIGKSLAYLVPGLLWALRSRRPLVISTYTRTLQDQILEKDLPHLRRLVDRELRAVVLKGRSNYLCRNRWRLFLEETRGTVEGEEVERALSQWVEYTETGDLSEAPLPPGKAAARILAAFPRISSETRSCSTPLCGPDSGCFFKRSRQRAKDAQLVIVNHSLLLIDLFSEAAGIPEWSAAIIDEAHHLPSAAAEPLSFSVSESGLESALKGLGGRGDPGLTEQLRHFLRAHPSKVERTGVLASLRALEEETGRLLLLARAFWDELRSSPVLSGEAGARQAGSGAEPKGAGRPVSSAFRLRYGPSSPVLGLFPAGGLEFCRLLSIHLEAMEKVIEEAEALRSGSAARPSESELLALLEAERHAEAARSELHALEELLTPTRPDFIYWIETGTGMALKASPLEVGPQLREHLFRRKESLVLTSATLAVMGDFHHMAGKLGLDRDAYEGICLTTPFRLEEQVGAWVVTGIPAPNSPGFLAALADGITVLARTLRRKMLVLFTSHEALRTVEGLIRLPLAERGILLFAQGVDGGQRLVRSGFQDGQGPAVLLGVASFWEGVDFPGEELEVLVMGRLPFPVPTDPLVEAMSEKLASEGRDPFRSFQVPEALIRFRQGFGRLIRRIGDRGVFVVCDSRLETRGYGPQFKQSLGIPFRQARGWVALAEEAAAWLNQPRAES
jgi:ATP-dependent DNA helicase DinG